MKQVILCLLLCTPIALLAQKKASPVAGFEADLSVCQGDTVLFTNTANTTNVYYDFGDGTDTRKENPLHIYPTAGSYLVKQTAYLDGTTATFELTVVVNPGPEVSLTFSRDAVADTVRMWIGQSLTVTVAESYPQYQWFRKVGQQWGALSSGDPSLVTTFDGAYKVLVSDAGGCQTEVPFWVIATAKPDDPNLINIIVENNVLTPNNDGVNDVLFVKDLLDPDIYTAPLALSVYNKAGVLIFQTDRYLNDWNGIGSSGQELASGTYYYVAQSEGRRGKAGFIDLIRSE